MLHLIVLEWKKQRDYLLFKLLVVAYVLFLPAVLLMLKAIPLEENLPFNPKTVFYRFPSVWEWLGYVGNWLVFFLFGFLAVLLVTNEHSSRTLRQNIISGLHRQEFFLSKLYFIAAVSLAATAYYCLCSLVIGFLHTDTIYFSTIFKNWALIPRFFLMGIGYMSFGLLVGVLVKRTGIALFIFIGYCFFLEPILRWAVHLQLFHHKSMNFYPLNAFEDLCPVPFFDETEQFLKKYNFQLFLTPTEAVLASLVYIGLFLWISYRRIKRSDL
jgi:ABC-type transport system involved in multi-copper enzyme maturation permease subunit